MSGDTKTFLLIGGVFLCVIGGMLAPIGLIGFPIGALMIFKAVA